MNAYRLVDAAGEGRHVRFRFEPELGVDPILHFRHHVYAESVRRRTGG